MQWCHQMCNVMFRALRTWQKYNMTIVLLEQYQYGTHNTSGHTHRHIIYNMHSGLLSACLKPTKHGATSLYAAGCMDSYITEQMVYGNGRYELKSNLANDILSLVPRHILQTPGYAANDIVCCNSNTILGNLKKL